jgi:phosphatidylinositol alpha-mannosyltransferase
MRNKITKKIGIISPYFFPHVGGVTNHVWNKYIWLKNLGFEVKVITPDFGKSEFDNEDIIKVGKPIPIIYNGSITFISLSFKVKDILEREKFDIIHAHEPYTPFSFLFIRNSEKSICTFHAFREEPEKIFVKMGEPLIKTLRKKISKVITVSKSAQRVVKETFGIDEQKTVVIPNGIDYDFFAKAEPIKSLRDGKFNILFVGRLEPRKGVKHLIRAYRIFKKIVPESRLIIVGEGMKTYYLSFVTEDIEKNVWFVGSVPPNTLAHLYKSADICVFPSTRGESFGIVLIEAMAAGKPVIAGNCEGYKETLENGRYGIVVDPKDEDSLARAMVELYYKEDLRKELSLQGQEYAKKFDWSNIIQKIVKVYNEAI